MQSCNERGRRVMTLRRSRAIALLAAAVVPLAAACGEAPVGDDDNEPTVTPYRPTVSNPADLSVPGWLEGEFGGLHVWNEDHSHGDSVPYLLKYAFDENYGVLLGGNAYVSLQTPGASAQSSFGDTTIEWKQRFPVAEKAAFGIEAGIVAPTAARELGVGKTAWLVNGIFSADLNAVHVDVNIGGEHLNEHLPAISAWQSSWAVAASTALAERWGAAFELSGTYWRGAATQSQALAALTYNASNRLVLDAGTSYGLVHNAHDRSVFAGATVLIGRLR
jgi:hypothetical protein